MTGFAVPELTSLGATSLMARFGERIDRALAVRIGSLVDTLERLAVPGVVDLIPSYTTLIVLFDPVVTSAEQLGPLLETTWAEPGDNQDADRLEARLIEIDVAYGGEAGPDLDDVARATGLPVDEVIRRHSEEEYTVGALGFSPGFAFLIGLPPELAVPRRATPRTRVPAGSVGIGGAQTGIYSLPTPGGWSLIGRTPRLMFDPSGTSGDALTLGDRVRFRPIPDGDAVTFLTPVLGEHATQTDDGALEIVAAGVQTSVQDLGRPGQGGQGITPGGAVDRSALIAGNRLLGNDDGAAAVEWTLLPPVIRVRERCRAVMTGADPGWRRNGAPVRIGEVVALEPGDDLQGMEISEALGARGYICVAGGIGVPEVRRSRALDLSAGFGGGNGRPLRQGDSLAIMRPSDREQADHGCSVGEEGDPTTRPFRVLRGPQADRFDDAAWATFLKGPFTVDPQSNRMGLRLNGPAVVPQGGADVISEGVVTGSVQVTGEGQPIVLLPGRATIGGYTKIATVIEADHDRLGQLRPGATIRFAEVSLDDARKAWRDWRPSIHGGLAMQDEGGVVNDGAGKPASNADAVAGAWTPEGVIAVIRELADHDVQAFSLRVEAAGLEIAIDRGGGLPGRPGRGYFWRDSEIREDTDTEYTDHVLKDAAAAMITAPLVGTFYRRPAPDEPVFVNQGDTVDAGQVVGLIEVMKTFNEVTATEPGVIARVLVDDGAMVEFGTSLMELELLSGKDRA